MILRLIVLLCSLWLASSDEFEEPQHVLITPNGDKVVLSNPPTASGLFQNDLEKIVLIHGSAENSTKVWYRNLSSAYLEKGNKQVIAIDWSQDRWQNYSDVAENIRLIGTKIGEFLLDLAKVENFSVSDYHLVAHSLGCHVAGSAGNHIYRTTGRRVGRITGLDAASTVYTDESYDYLLKKGDAEVVAGIHTDSFGTGVGKPYGDVDLYANSGSRQPGCLGDVWNYFLDFCSHHRSYVYWTEGVHKNVFWGRKCNSWKNFRNGKCNHKKILNFVGNITKKDFGIYYTTTNDQQPFLIDIPSGGNDMTVGTSEKNEKKTGENTKNKGKKKPGNNRTPKHPGSFDYDLFKKNISASFVIGLSIAYGNRPSNVLNIDSTESNGGSVKGSNCDGSDCSDSSVSAETEESKQSGENTPSNGDSGSRSNEDELTTPDVDSSTAVSNVHNAPGPTESTSTDQDKLDESTKKTTDDITTETNLYNESTEHTTSIKESDDRTMTTPEKNADVSPEPSGGSGTNRHTGSPDSNQDTSTVTADSDPRGDITTETHSNTEPTEPSSTIEGSEDSTNIKTTSDDDVTEPTSDKPKHTDPSMHGNEPPLDPDSSTTNDGEPNGPGGSSTTEADMNETTPHPGMHVDPDSSTTNDGEPNGPGGSSTTEADMNETTPHPGMHVDPDSSTTDDGEPNGPGGSSTTEAVMNETTSHPGMHVDPDSSTTNDGEPNGPGGSSTTEADMNETTPHPGMNVDPDSSTTNDGEPNGPGGSSTTEADMNETTPHPGMHVDPDSSTTNDGEPNGPGGSSTTEVDMNENTPHPGMHVDPDSSTTDDGEPNGPGGYSTTEINVNKNPTEPSTDYTTKNMNDSGEDKVTEPNQETSADDTNTVSNTEEPTGSTADPNTITGSQEGKPSTDPHTDGKGMMPNKPEKCVFDKAFKKPLQILISSLKFDQELIWNLLNLDAKILKKIQNLRKQGKNADKNDNKNIPEGTGNSVGSDNKQDIGDTGDSNTPRDTTEQYGTVGDVNEPQNPEEGPVEENNPPNDKSQTEEDTSYYVILKIPGEQDDGMKIFFEKETREKEVVRVMLLGSTDIEELHKNPGKNTLHKDVRIGGDNDDETNDGKNTISMIFLKKNADMDESDKVTNVPGILTDMTNETGVIGEDAVVSIGASPDGIVSVSTPDSDNHPETFYIVDKPKDRVLIVPASHEDSSGDKFVSFGAHDHRENLSISYDMPERISVDKRKVEKVKKTIKKQV